MSNLVKEKISTFLVKYRFIVLFTIILEFLTFVIITLVSGYVPPNGGVGGKWRISQIVDLPSYIFNISQTWDGIHYLNIAQNWYSPLQPSEYAFFPLLPLIIKLIAFIMPFFSIYTASVITSLLLFIILGISLKTMFCELSFPDKSDELTLLALIFPLSIFYLFIYTESLFIIITIILTLLLKNLHLQTKKSKIPIFIGILISSFLLSITRNLGFLYGFSIFCCHLFSIIANTPKLLRKEYFKSTIKSLFASFSIFLAGLSGLVLVLSIGYFTAGDFLKSYDAQKYWGRKTEWNIFKTIFKNFINIFQMNKVSEQCNYYLDCIYGFTYPLFGLLVSLITVSLLIVIYKKKIVQKNIFKTENLYIISLVLFSTLLTTISITKGLNGYNRYIISTPLYYLGLPIIFLKVIPQKYQQIIIACSAILFTVFICLFGLHYWVG